MTPLVRRFRVRIGQRWFTVEVRQEPHARPQVWVEGQPVEVEILPEAPSPPPRAQELPQSLPPTLTREEATIISPMPGRVVAVSVKVGDRLRPGDEICVIEAMKMEQSIRCVRGGVVKALYIQPGQTVHAGDILAELGEG